MIEFLNNPIIYYLLIAAFCLLFSYLTYRDLRRGIYLISAFLWSYIIRFQIWFIPLTLLEAMILIIFAIWLIKLVISHQSSVISLKIFNKQLLIANYFLPTILFLFAATIGIIVSPDLRQALGIWKAYFVEPILFFIIFINTIKTKKDLENVFYALGILTIIIAIFAIYQKITGNFIPVPMWQPKEHRRVNTFFDSPNAIGLLLGPVIIIYFGLILEHIKKFILHTSYFILHRELLIIGYKLLILILGILSIIFAVSRSSWFAVATGIIFILFFGWSKKLTAFLVAIIITIILITPTARNYLEPIVTFKVTSGDVRLVLWQGSWKLIKANPIFGAGLAGFPLVYNKYRLPQHIEILLYPHNIIMNFWSEIGLLGLVAIIWIIAKFFHQGHQLILNLKSKILNLPSANNNIILVITLLAVMIEIIIHGLVDVPYFKNDLSVLFWLIIGMMAVIENLFKKEYNQ